jgi:hypothetical protein
MKKAWIAAAVGVVILCSVVLMQRLRREETTLAPEPPPLVRSKPAAPLVADDEASRRELGIHEPMGPLDPPPPPMIEPPAEKPAVVLGVASPTSLRLRVGAEQQTVHLASLLSPGACGDAGLASFNAEAARYLASMVEGEEVVLTKAAGNAYLVTRARDERDVNLAMLRNGYACADPGDLPAECPLTYVAHEKSARTHKRGMWRGGAALADGYVPESQNAAAIFRNRGEQP